MSRLKNYRVFLVGCIAAALLIALTAPLSAQRPRRIDPPVADDISTPPADEGVGAADADAARDIPDEADTDAVTAAAEEAMERETVAGGHDIALSQAHAAIEAAAAKAAELDTKMDIAIVDAGGNLKAFARMDGAWLGSIDISIKKAKTARWFDMNTGEIGKLSQPGGPLYGIEHSNEGLITFPGGVPIRVGDRVIGAIGVSGSSVENDHEVAMAGAEAVSGGGEGGGEDEGADAGRPRRGERRQPRRIERNPEPDVEEGEGRNEEDTAVGEGERRRPLPPTE